MTNKNALEIIEKNPPQAQPIATIIWLHGLGADGSDFVPMVQELQLPTNLPIRFIFPNAPMQAVTINQGYVMRAWYDIISLHTEKHADEKGIAQSVANVSTLIANEEARGITSDRIVLGGFSQGAVLALTTGLLYPKKLAGILALSGYLPNAQDVFKKNQANHATPIFLAHGSQDTVVPCFLGQATHENLIRNNFSVEWHSYPIPHTVSADEIRDIRQWLIKVLS